MRPLKRLVLILFVVSVTYIIVFIGINFIFKASLIGSLEKRLSTSLDAEVNIKGLKTNLLTQLTLSQIQIRRDVEPALLLDIFSFDFKYSPLSLFQGRFKGKIELKGLSLVSNDLKIKEDILINFSLKPRFFDKALSLEEFTLSLRNKPVFMAKGSSYPIFKPKRLVLAAQISLLSYPDFNLKDLNLEFNFSKDRSLGDLSIGVLDYNRLSLNNLTSKLSLFNKRMRLKNLKANTFGGRLEGELNLSLSSPIGYNLYLRVVGLNLKEILKTFAPSDWQATGIIDGDLKISIEEKELKGLQGKLYSRGTGTVAINTIKELLSHARVIIDKKALKKDVIFYESLIGDISLHKNEIIVELHLIAKEIDLKFEIKIEPEVLGTFLIERR